MIFNTLQIKNSALYYKLIQMKCYIKKDTTPKR